MPIIPPSQEAAVPVDPTYGNRGPRGTSLTPEEREKWKNGLRSLAVRGYYTREELAAAIARIDGGVQ